MHYAKELTLMSQFNPDVFLNQTQTGGMATHRTPIPEDEYMAFVDSGDKAVVLRMIDIKKGDRAGQQALICDVWWNITDEKAKAALPNRDKILCKQSFFVDLKADGQTIDNGEDKNLKLGRTRTALGQNDPNNPWAFFMLKGAGPARVKVKQRPDDDDETIIYDEVVAVAPWE